jgi:DNA-binding CsgD family transcriptional regulator/tetratricopeptide (TPR) repeat protein
MSASVRRSPPPEPALAAVGEGGQRPAHVGRRQELQAWREAVRAARQGSGGVVVVTGEAGIGKSRLVEECLATGGASVRATVGACPPVAGADLPYAPVLQGLRDLGRGLPAVERDRLVAGWPPELARLVLSPASGRTSGEDPAGAVAASLPELPVSPTAQVRFFEGLLRVLVRLAQQRPVAFVIEDLHWADRSTLDLLAYLASNVRAEAVVLLLTSRDELERGDPLRRWLAEVCRLPYTRRLQLNRLTRAETAQLLAGLLRDVPDPDLVDAVFARAEGNPLFTEMLLAENRAGTTELPPVLRDLLGARFAELSDSGQRLLRVASAAGRRVQHELLAEVADVAPDDLDRGLRELVDRQVLRPAAEGEAFDFRHELFREVAYADLLPGQRRRVHRALAEVLTRRPDLAAGGTAASAGETAHHYIAAGDWARALPVGVEAGLAAERAFAFADALHHLRAAAEAWDRVPDADRLSPLPRAALLSRAAQAADLVGNQALAVDLVEQALTAVDRADSRAVALLYERRGTFHYNAGHADAAHADFTAALALLPAEPPSAERARVHASLALLNMAWTRLDDASRAALESIRLAQAVGATREEGRARNALGVVTAYAGDLDSGVAELTAALRLAEEVADPDDIAAAAIDLGHVLGVAGRYEEAVRACLDGYETARRLGLEREHGGFLLANAAECLIKSGRWGQAEQLLADALHRAPRGLRAFPVLMQTAWLAVRRGRYEAAAERLVAARALLDDSGGGPSGWRRELLEGEAELAVGQGRTRDAFECVDRGLTLAEQADEQRFAGPLIATGMRAAADEAERGRARREPAVVAAADAAADALWTRASRLRPCPVDDEVVVLPETAALAAMCAGERGRRTDRPDAPAWERAATAWQGLGRPYEGAYAQWRRAEALIAGGQLDPATTALRAAHAAASELGAEGLLAEITALAGWRRVALEVLEPAPATAADDTLGLTARELEVLTRVTAGQTNRQIAEGLFISVKTASVHVSNILRKLEVGGREDAARIGRQLGLSPQHSRPS